jgi:hypothetical protein
MPQVTGYYLSQGDNKGKNRSWKRQCDAESKGTSTKTHVEIDVINN